MDDYYEELWRALPEDLELPDFARRRGFLLAHVRAGDRVLDIGCGSGEFTATLVEAGAQAIGADIASAAIERAYKRHPGLDFRHFSTDRPLPFDDGAFDVVWASEVLEHVADTARWLSEVRRVLVPRGRLLVTTPSHGRVRLLLYGIERFSEPLGDHLHLYTSRSLKTLLREFGFGELRLQSVGLPLLRRLLLAHAVR